MLVRRSVGLLAALLLVAAAAHAQTAIHINADNPIFTDTVPFTIAGTSDAPAGTKIVLTVENNAPVEVAVDAAGAWSYQWTTPLATGTYTITASANGVTATQDLRVQLQLPTNLQRQTTIEAPKIYGTPELPSENYMEMTDRWRIVPPSYELDENPRARAIGKRGATLDPYNKNLIKGDYPIFGKDWFLVLTGISDTLSESRTLPTPSGVSTVHPASIKFFGKDDQNQFGENLDFSFDLFEGDTAFKPVTQRVKVTLIQNLNYLHVRENAIVKPDVRRGTKRTNGFLALQEIFYERKLKDLSPNYDFVSVRVGSQPFTSDFRGFIFSDTNLGARLFGNYASNRYQYNLAIFDRREKDTNSGLNTLTERRGQQVGIANFYWQDFFFKGYTEEFSIHYMRDEAELKYDRNGILVRPAPIGVFTPHSINAVYFGTAGLGHIGRFNIDHAIYYVTGHDSINPLAGPDPALKQRNGLSIGAGMAAVEVSYDHDWLRPRVALFYAQGDRNPRDRTGRGFDSIFDSPQFAGGGFSFFNRLGIKLAGSGVDLVQRGSLLPDLKSSKDEGQPNYVNPGVQLASVGCDADITPRLKAIVTANYIRLDTTKPIEALLFQTNIHRSLGTDVSLGAKYRPFLSNNWVVVGGVAAFVPGQGFKDIYEHQHTLYHVFTNVILTF